MIKKYNLHIWLFIILCIGCLSIPLNIYINYLNQESMFQKIMSIFYTIMFTVSFSYVLGSMIFTMLHSVEKSKVHSISGILSKTKIIFLLVPACLYLLYVIGILKYDVSSLLLFLLIGNRDVVDQHFYETKSGIYYLNDVSMSKFLIIKYKEINELTVILHLENGSEQYIRVGKKQRDILEQIKTKITEYSASQ